MIIWNVSIQTAPFLMRFILCSDVAIKDVDIVDSEMGKI